jgi:hypothetical protein
VQEVTERAAQAVQLPDNERVAAIKAIQRFVEFGTVPAAGFPARLVFLVNCCATVGLKCADLSRGILFISADTSVTDLDTNYIGTATGE